MYKEILEDYNKMLKMPIINCFNETRDRIDFMFKVDEDNPIQAYRYYKDTFDDMSYEDQDRYADEEIDGDSYGEITLKHYPSKRYDEEKENTYWKTCWCGETLDENTMCPSCKQKWNIDILENQEGCATYRKPYRIHMSGCDDASYSKVFATLEEAMKHIELIKRLDDLDMYKWINEFGYAFTN